VVGIGDLILDMASSFNHLPCLATLSHGTRQTLHNVPMRGELEAGQADTLPPCRRLSLQCKLVFRTGYNVGEGHGCLQRTEIIFRTRLAEIKLGRVEESIHAYSLKQGDSASRECLQVVVKAENAHARLLSSHAIVV
jgi:hypothetical protein